MNFSLIYAILFSASKLLSFMSNVTSISHLCGNDRLIVCPCGWTKLVLTTLLFLPPRKIHPICRPGSITLLTHLPGGCLVIFVKDTWEDWLPIISVVHKVYAQSVTQALFLPIFWKTLVRLLPTSVVPKVYVYSSKLPQPW